MAGKNGLSQLTYAHVFWSLDTSAQCKDTIFSATPVDHAIVRLREDLLRRVNKGKPMRLPLERREDGSLECMEDILKNRQPVVNERALPFRERRVPEAHLKWLRGQIKARGLSEAISIKDL